MGNRASIATVKITVLTVAVGGGLFLSSPVCGALGTAEVAKLLAADGAADDGLGRAVAVDGDLAVVGAPFDDDNGSGSGAAYIFARNQGGADAWGQVAKLAPPTSAAGDGFGWAVAIDGDTVVVGAPFDDDACIADPLCDSGGVYVFKRNQGGADTWGQRATLGASDAAAGDKFGFAVAIDNDTVVVGAPGDDDAGQASGSAYVFERNEGGAGTWDEVEKLAASGAAAGDELGISVGISGDRIVVGALAGDAAVVDSGTAHVFERNQGGADAWGEVAELSAADAAAGDEFGRAVAIANGTVVVGAGRDDDAGAESGSAYVFTRNQGGADLWGQAQKLTASDAAAGDRFGWTVDIAGDAVAVGAYLADNDVDAGAVYLFERNRGGPDAWGGVQRIAASDPAAQDHFGLAVALAVDSLIVGAPGDDDAGSGSGSAYLLARVGALWEQIEKPVSTDLETGDELGRSVAVSGGIAVVGSPWDDDDGAFSGSAYVFARNQGGGDGWDQVMKLTGSDATTGDQFGLSVAVAGETVVVGAKNADTVAVGGGATYVFERNQGGAEAWGEVTILAPAGLEGPDQFGVAVAIWGDTIVVGDPSEDDACVADSACESGAAYVFQRNEGGAEGWGLVAKLTASDAAAGDELGTAVAIRGDLIVVGAPFDDDACGGDPCSSGSAYVFERNQGGADNWGEVRKLVADDDAFGDELGAAVAIAEDAVAAGAPLEGSAAGAVYVFRRNQGGADQWGQAAKLTSATTSGSLGGSVSFSGDRLVAGARFDDGSCAGAGVIDCGAAVVFERNQGGGDAWGEVWKLEPLDPEDQNQFGFAVSIDGPTVLVGSPRDDDACPADPLCFSGSSYLFRLRAVETDLSISKDDGLTEIEREVEISYTLVVANNGTEDATGVVVADALDPLQFDPTATQWFCLPAPGSSPETSCPASGIGAELAAGVTVDIAAGDSVIFAVDSETLASAVGPIVNTATVASPTIIDDNAGNNSATDSDHLLVQGACGFFEDRVVGQQVIDTSVEIVACNSITLGPDLQLDPTAVVEARAGATVRFEGDVSVLDGAQLTLTIDPALLP